MALVRAVVKEVEGIIIRGAAAAAVAVVFLIQAMAQRQPESKPE